MTDNSKTIRVEVELTEEDVRMLRDERHPDAFGVSAWAKGKLRAALPPEEEQEPTEPGWYTALFGEREPRLLVGYGGTWTAYEPDGQLTAGPSSWEDGTFGQYTKIRRLDLDALAEEGESVDVWINKSDVLLMGQAPYATVFASPAGTRVRARLILPRKGGEA